MSHHHARRRENVERLLAEEGLDAFLVTSPHNVRYLTGFTGDSSALLVLPARVVLVSDPRYVGLIADECPELQTHIRTPAQKLHEAVGEVLGKLGLRSVGIESAALSLAEAQALGEVAKTVDWKPGSDRVERFRMVKDETEIADTRRAVRIAERAFSAFRAMLRPPDTEKDLADLLDGLMRRAGAAECAFPTIMAVGARAGLPHCPPTGRRVQEAGLLLVDWGAALPSGYRSDLTRVIDTHKTCGSGASRDTLARVHAAVLAAQQAALRAVRPGVACQDVDRAARAVIEEAGFGGRFGHGLGHGLGLQIHEAPAVRQLSTTELAVGMVFTLEPGIYLPEWGGVRIEDDVLVTADGCEVLSSVPRELEALALEG